uniref:Uncharacterized protein n=1 Tax=Cannabis sativa TaxID=3483 RepID=A0A803Q325_CANSA
MCGSMLRAWAVMEGLIKTMSPGDHAKRSRFALRKLISNDFISGAKPFLIFSLLVGEEGSTSTSSNSSTHLKLPARSLKRRSMSASLLWAGLYCPLLGFSLEFLEGIFSFLALDRAKVVVVMVAHSVLATRGSGRVAGPTCAPGESWGCRMPYLFCKAFDHGGLGHEALNVIFQRSSQPVYIFHNDILNLGKGQGFKYVKNGDPLDRSSPRSKGSGQPYSRRVYGRGWLTLCCVAGLGQPLLRRDVGILIVAGTWTSRSAVRRSSGRLDNTDGATRILLMLTMSSLLSTYNVMHQSHARPSSGRPCTCRMQAGWSYAIQKLAGLSLIVSFECWDLLARMLGR